MEKTRLASALFVTCLASLAAAPAGASLVLALDTTELARRADHIAIVDVVAIQSSWDDQHRKIITTVDLSVVESWKGGAAPATHIKVIQPGGTVGDVAMVVFGQSQFALGERTLVFLRGKPSGAGVVGMAQGKRPMRRDTASGQWMIDGADHTGLHLVTPTAPASTPARALSSTPAAPLPALDSRPRTLDEMRGQIRQILKAQQ